MVQIFNVMLFSSDAKWFCELSYNEQFDWIKCNTNQQNDEIIADFLSKPLKSDNGYCFTCRANKEKVNLKDLSNGNISNGVSEKTSISSEDNQTSGDGKSTNRKRRR